MATLNVKGFPDELYARLREQAAKEHRSIAQQITHLLSQSLTEPPSYSIFELRGMGKEVWRGVDSAEHVDRERRSWD